MPRVPALSDERDSATQLATISFKAQVLTPPPPNFEIKIENYVWRVHIDVFGAKSDFFKALQESRFKEGREGSVTLFEDRPALIARFILWTYCGSYQVYRSSQVQSHTVDDILDSGLRQPFQNASPVTPSKPPQSVWHAQLEDMSMPEDPTVKAGLKRKRDNVSDAASITRPSTASSVKKAKTPEERMKTEILEHWDMYVVADKYGCPELRSYCVHSMFYQAHQKRSSIWYLVDCVNTASIPVEDIRQGMIAFFKTYCKMYLGEPRFEELVRTTPELAWVLVKDYAGRG